MQKFSLNTVRIKFNVYRLKNEKGLLQGPFSFLVCRAWQIARRCKSVMGVCSCQPLADGKGVHCEVESKGSLMQNSDLRNTNNIRHILWDEFAKQNEVQKLHGHKSVNVTGTWNESYLSYHGRSHERVET